MGSLKTTLITNLSAKRIVPNKPVEFINFNKGEEVIVRFEDVEIEEVRELLRELHIAEDFEEIDEDEKQNMGDIEGVIELTKDFPIKRNPRKKIPLISLSIPNLPVKFDSVEFVEIRP